MNQPRINYEIILHSILIKLTFLGGKTEIFREGTEVMGIYFSTQSMRRNLKNYPNMVHLDGTYKLLNVGWTVFLFLVEDGQRSTEIVGVAIVKNETRIIFTWLLQTFLKENEGIFEKIQCFMGDKDLLEREVIKQLFPHVDVYMCLFHTLQTFKRNMSKEKMNLKGKEKEQILKL